MAAVSELIRVEDDGTLSFGDYTKKEKTKKSDFKANGGIYKVKTFNEITRLECDDEFVFESDPGTAVFHFLSKDDGVSFEVEGHKDADITVGLEPEAEYDIVINGTDSGKMKTNLGGKLTISVELGDKTAKVDIKKA